MDGTIDSFGVIANGHALPSMLSAFTRLIAALPSVHQT